MVCYSCSGEAAETGAAREVKVLAGDGVYKETKIDEGMMMFMPKECLEHVVKVLYMSDTKLKPCGVTCKGRHCQPCDH